MLLIELIHKNEYLKKMHMKLDHKKSIKYTGHIPASDMVAKGYS